MRHGAVWTAALIVTIAAARCDGHCSREPRPASSLEVWIRGCHAFRVGLECRIVSGRSTTLTLWVSEADSSRLTVLLDGRAQPVAPSPIAGGLRFRLAVEHAPSTLTVQSEEPGVRKIRKVWTARIVAADQPAELLKARRLRASGDFAAAEATVAPLTLDSRPEVRARALALAGRIARARGRTEDAIHALEQSIELHRAHGSASAEMSDRYALAFIKIDGKDYAAVDDIFAAIPLLAASDPAGAARAGYYRGYAALAVGDYRRALRLFEQARVDATKVDLPDLWRSAAEMEIRTLRALGRQDDARALLRRLEARLPAGPVCIRATALSLVGRFIFELASRAPDVPRAQERLHEAAELLERKCPDAVRLAETLALLGFARLATGEEASATELLARSRAAHPSPPVPTLLRQYELDAEIALAQEKYAAADAQFSRLYVLGELLSRPELRWKASLGRGQALERLGRAREALAALRDAERLLDRQHILAPLGGGRESFLRDRAQSASHLVGLLLAEDRVGEAADVARRSRARLMSALRWSARLEAASEETRRRWYRATTEYRRHRSSDESWVLEEWRLDRSTARRLRTERREEEATARRLVDQALAELGEARRDSAGLSPLLPGELRVVYHPVPSGWAAFVFEHTTVTALRFGLDDGTSDSKDEIARTLLEPLAPMLERADRVRFEAFGLLNAVDFHALPYRDRPLVEELPVLYGVDMAPLPRTPSGPAGRLVVDPHDDLRWSRQEADFAEQQLGLDEGAVVTRLRGHRATPRAFREALAATPVGLLHYAGHARYAGLDGWESYLGNPSQTLMSIGDILMLPRAPTHVVLSGCETGSTRGTGAPGLGLAQAFVAAGAESVVSAVRPIDDEGARHVLLEFYRAVDRRQGWDAAAQLRKAQLKMIAERPEVDWASFRVLVP